MAKVDEKQKALQLRRKGLSIKEISEILNVSKGSISLWCRNVNLTKRQKNYLYKKQVLAGHRGRLIGAEINRQKKLKNVANQESMAEKLIGPLSERDKLMLGIGLYWGEGVKSSASIGASIVNSDPKIILFMRDWLEQLGVCREDFRPYIYISEIHKQRENKIMTYWSDYLDIPLAQFHKIIFLKGRPKKVYENHDSYFGIVSLRVRKSTTLKYFILGLIKSCTKAGKK